MDYDKFINDYLGKPIDYDGEYGPQCVDLANQYLHDNGKPIPWVEGAKDFANNPALLPAFDWITNDPNDVNQVPQRGDIVVFSGWQPGSGDADHNPATGNGYGHINIFDMVTGAHTWQGLDQNWGGQTVHFVPNHVYTYVLGWWHVKAAPVAQLTPVAPDPNPLPAPVVTPEPVVIPEVPAPQIAPESVTIAPEIVTVAVTPAPEVVTRTTSVSHLSNRPVIIEFIESIIKALYKILIGEKK